MRCIPVSVKRWRTVVLGNYTVIIAQTACQKFQGLQWEKEPLPDNTVIMFLNIPSGIYFHTVNCTFPIDIVALDRDGKVLAIWKNVPPNENRVGPMPSRINRVVEATAGWVDTKSIDVGDILPFVNVSEG